MIEEAISKQKKNEKVINQISMHCYSEVCKQRKCNYINSDEDCEIYLQWEKCMHSKCRHIQRQKGSDREKEGQTRTDSDRQGQKGTSRGRKGPFMSLTCPCLVPACTCLPLLVPALSLALTVKIGK